MQAFQTLFYFAQTIVLFGSAWTVTIEWWDTRRTFSPFIHKYNYVKHSKYKRYTKFKFFYIPCHQIFIMIPEECMMVWREEVYEDDKKIMRQIFLETKTVYKYRPQIWKFSFSLRRQVRKELKAASRNHTNFSDGEIWGNPFTLICKPLESFHRYYPCLESIIQWAERPHW